MNLASSSSSSSSSFKRKEAFLETEQDVDTAEVLCRFANLKVPVLIITVSNNNNI
jgi:hypothetical protein